MPQERGLSGIVDDDAARQNASSVECEVARCAAASVSLQAVPPAAVAAANTGADQTTACMTSTEGAWIEVTKSKGKKKGRG